LAPQLAPLSALATRWRRLELGAWRGLLEQTKRRAAAVAHQASAWPAAFEGPGLAVQPLCAKLLRRERSVQAG
jgi:midasin